MIDFLRALFDPLFYVLGATLQEFHSVGAPWWLAIIMLTVTVRTLLFPLTLKQAKSMRKMQELKPLLDEIRTKHEGDTRKQQEEQMKVYGERGINPLGGCLPALVQLPIFLVLYYTIKEFEHLESFRTGGLFWFQDLTAADPYFILPIAYVLTMVASQELAIRNTDPQQKKLMRLMPLAFGLFLVFGGFPAGLFVYWVASNTITFCQNLFVYRGSRFAQTPATALVASGGAEETIDDESDPLDAGEDRTPSMTAGTQGPARKRRGKSKRKKAKRSR